MIEVILGVMSRQSLWTVVQSSIQSGGGEHQFKVTNRQLTKKNEIAWPFMGAVHLTHACTEKILLT